MEFRDNTALIIDDDYEHSTPNEKAGHNNRNKSNKPVANKKHNYIGIALSGIVITALLFIMIYGKVQVSALYTAISTEKEVVDILESENVRMQSEIESNMSLKNVESYAENVLGLKKLDKSQIVYIQIQNEDNVQVVETEDNIFVNIKEKFNDIVEYLFG